jgi:hypothetical protein
MNCPLGTRDQDLLVAYSSHQLDVAKAAMLDKHMAECGPCREFVRGQKAVWEALDIWEPEAISPDFNRRLYQRIDAQVTWSDRLMRPLRPLVFHKNVSLAAAAGLVLALGLVLNQAGTPPRRPVAKSSHAADIEGLQADQVVKALDEMEALSRFNRLMKPETPESKM